MYKWVLFHLVKLHFQLFYLLRLRPDKKKECLNWLLFHFFHFHY
ncbi:hypothetical protein IIV6-T1_213 [Invertebrate iridescent virus 6]|nr:hypothetical protein IIV6-T1_213 [Invertebrate iridescent virus 6]